MGGVGCPDWFTPVVRTNGELDATLKRARDEIRPSYIEVRVAGLPTALPQRDPYRQYQLTPAPAAGLEDRRPDDRRHRPFDKRS